MAYHQQGYLSNWKIMYSFPSCSYSNKIFFLPESTKHSVISTATVTRYYSKLLILHYLTDLHVVTITDKFIETPLKPFIEK